MPGGSRERFHILIDYVPVGPIQAKRIAGQRLDLDQCQMVKTSLFEAQRLPASTRANF